tara:strand:- start:309 stop:650 length:342 start_codon:yes stop_codon:yes gene_type:complete
MKRVISKRNRSKKIKVMSDSIKKYYELSDQGGTYTIPGRGGENVPTNYIYEDINGELTVKNRRFNSTSESYTELELVETVINIARHSDGVKHLSAEVLLALAKSELSVKKVCD